MNFKRISAVALALAMTASTAAFAEEAVPTSGLLISSNPNALSESYNGVVSINGEEIDSVTYTFPVEGSWEEIENVVAIDALSGAPAGYVPLRLVCQATEGGYASWFKEENRSMFVLNEKVIFTDFNDNTIYVRDEDRNDVLQEGYTCFLRGGATYVPAAFLATLDGISVDSYTFEGEEIFDFTIETPGTPMEKLVKKIQETVSMSGGMDVNEYFSFQEVDVSAFEEITGELPMFNTRADVVVIAKWAEDADKEAGKAALKVIQDNMISTFEQYLPGPLEVAKNGQIVESEDGKYVMLILSENNEQAIQLFQEGILVVEAESNGIKPR